MDGVRQRKRCFGPDDKFFEGGNLVCRLIQEKYIPPTMPSKSSSDDARDGMEIDQYNIDCQIQGCYQQFHTLASFEEHYATRHRNVCQTCGRVLPTSHLLEIHLNELHNPMFDILTKSSQMYLCLVSGCQEKFNNAKQRKKHLVEVHKYPSSFRFDRKPPPKNKQNITPSKSRQHINNKTRMDIDDSSINGTVDNGVETSPSGRFKYSYKVPANFSFGSGVQKGFMRKRSKQPRGNHLTGKQKSSAAEVKQVDIEDVDMNELAQALDS